MTAPPQPAAPAPRDAGVGERERVSVDAAAVTALSELVTANRGWSDYTWRGAALDVVKSSLPLIATARPLAPAPGAVDAATLADWRWQASEEGFEACLRTSWDDRTAARSYASTLRAACDALAAAPRPAPVHAPDRAAVEAAVDRLIDNARALGRCEARDDSEADVTWVDEQSARAALLALVFPATPAHDADAAGEAVGDG